MFKIPPYNLLLIGSDLSILAEELEKRNHNVAQLPINPDTVKKLAKIEASKIDIIIMNFDSNGKSCWDMLSRCRSFPNTKNQPIIVLSDFDDETSQIQALSLGADTYLVKPYSLKLLMAYIDANMRKNNYSLLDDLELPCKARTGERLTRKEQEILTYIIKGYTNKQIGEKVYITTLTAANHVKNIFKKLNVNNRTQAVLYALKNNLTPNIQM